MTQGKRYKAAISAVDRNKTYPLDEAVKLVKANAKAKFDETIEVAMNLGIDPRHADQAVRGMVELPSGTGKTVRVAVFARAGKADEAKAAGADLVGAEDLAEKINAGEINFDRCVATPDMMGVVGRLGKVLGPRGLMPNPKLGTVTQDVTAAVKGVTKAAETTWVRACVTTSTSTAYCGPTAMPMTWPMMPMGIPMKLLARPTTSRVRNRVMCRT